MTFSTLLIANRGEIARRVIRGARSMGLRCVAVYVDADTFAPHVRDADEAVRLTGGYLDQEAILAAARAGCSATLSATTTRGGPHLVADASVPGDLGPACLPDNTERTSPSDCVHPGHVRLTLPRVHRTPAVPVIPIEPRSSRSHRGNARAERIGRPCLLRP